MPPLTLEQQKEYVRRVQAGGRAMDELRIEETRRMSGAERWASVEQLQQALAAGLRPERTVPENLEAHGMAEQQRLFAKLHRRG